MQKSIILWVDASFNQWDGSFAWAGVFEVDGEKDKIGKGGLSCKNSTMAEAIGILHAAIELAERYPNSKIDVRSDCQTVILMCLGESFASDGNIGRIISEIKNFDKAKLSFNWIKGHAQGWETKDKAFNKHADRHANELRKKKAA